MPLQPPSRLCAAFADAVVGANTIDEAYAALTATVLDGLRCESMLFARRNKRWARVAGLVAPEREHSWRASLDQFGALSPAVVRLEDPEAGSATAVVISDDERLVLVIENDWTASADLLEVCADVIHVSLRTLRQRDASRRSDRLLRRMYRLTRRVGAADLDTLLTQVVDEVATMFSADRVSIALYDELEDVLRVKAARGTPLSTVQDLKIRPGDWILGRVFSSGKSLIVNDSGSLPAPHAHHSRYRSQSFAVLPLRHRNRTIGVLSITDGPEGAPFGAPQQFAMKTLAAVIAGALAGAGTDAEMARLRHVASVDSLSGLLNRAYLDSRLQQEVARSQREGTEFAVLMADIDDFKRINDSRGHQSGDAVIKGVGDIMRSAVRVFDVCARWGGDEFAVLMPNSDRTSALACAERIRLKTSQYLGDLGGSAFGLTVSIGVAVGGPGDTAAEVVARADRALYDAKAQGKDAVRVWGADSAQPVSDVQAGSQPAVEAVPPGDGVILRLPYILVADPALQRAEVYRSAADQSRLGLLVVRSGEQAERIIEQFGPPVLLVVDTTAAEMRAVSLIEAVQAQHQPILVVAFSSSRAFREYAGSKPGRLHLDVLRPDAPAAAVRAVIDRALSNREALPVPTLEPDPEQAARTRQSVDALTARTVEIIAAPGVAVYLRDPGETQVRATVTWLSDAMMARAHYHVPGVVERVLKTAEPVMAGAVGATAGASATADSYGLVASPVRRDNEVIGAVCAFGDEPLSVGPETLPQFDKIAADAFAWGAEAESETGVADQGSGDAAPGEDNRRAGDPSDGPVDDVGALGDFDWQPALLERRRGEFAVARELARVRREQRQLSVVLFDVAARSSDPAASNRQSDDQLLQGVADTLVRAIRQSDLPIQWSGNELLLVLPGLAGPEARAVAERVRAAMQAGGGPRVAVAGGVAELDTDEQFASVVRRARTKLTEALDRGHNRVS